MSPTSSGAPVHYLRMIVRNTGVVPGRARSFTDDLSNVVDGGRSPRPPWRPTGAPSATTRPPRRSAGTATSPSERWSRSPTPSRSTGRSPATARSTTPCSPRATGRPATSLTPIPDRCQENVPGKQLSIVKATEPGRSHDGRARRRRLVHADDHQHRRLRLPGPPPVTWRSVEDDMTGVLDDADGPTPAQITVTGPGTASFDPATRPSSWTGPIAVDEVAVVRYAVTVHPVVTGDAHLLNVVAVRTAGAVPDAGRDRSRRTRLRPGLREGHADQRLRGRQVVGPDRGHRRAAGRRRSPTR